MPNAIIFTEGSSQMGMGHLTRCAALADELENLGWVVGWRINGDSSAAKFLGPRSIRIENWYATTIDYHEYNSTDLAIIDSYYAPSESYEKIAKEAVRTIYLDDFVRLIYPRGHVVNTVPGADKLPYILGKYTRLLAGSKYFTLRKEFQPVFVRTIRGKVERILISLGATDLRGLSLESCLAAQRIFPDADIRIVIPDETQGRQWDNDQFAGNVQIYGRQSALEMRSLMEWADICISAAGQTLYELCHMGSPTVAVAVAENQKLNVLGFGQEGAILFAGWWNQEYLRSGIEKALEEIIPIQTRKMLALKGQALVEGRGSVRVFEEILSDSISIRRAQEADAKLLWDWTNDPQVRANSFSTEPVPWVDHLRWLTSKLHSSNSRLFIGQTSGSVPVGQIRFDFEENVSKIGISVDSAFRGKGISEQLIHLATKKVRNEFPDLSIQCLVKTDNFASQRAFQKCGFKLLGKVEFNGVECLSYQYEG